MEQHKTKRRDSSCEALVHRVNTEQDDEFNGDGILPFGSSSSIQSKDGIKVQLF